MPPPPHLLPLSPLLPSSCALFLTLPPASPLFLEVRILKELEGDFSEVRILKDLVPSAELRVASWSREIGMG